MKKFISLFVGVAAVLTLSACTEASVEAESYYVAIDINPSIEFIVDQDDIVVSFNLLNEDAEVLVAGINFIGMNIDDAVELFIQTATEAGYIDVDSEDNAVLITVLGSEENEFITGVRNRIKERVGRFFVRNYIQGEILSEDFTEADLVAQAEELGVTPGKLALALLILDTDTEEVYVLEDLLTTPVKDLVLIVRTYHEDAIKEYTQAQLEDFQARREAMFELHKARFDEFVANHPELTEEQIDELWQGFQQHLQETTRDRWHNRIETWRENHQLPPLEENPDSNSEENPTTN